MDQGGFHDLMIEWRMHDGMDDEVPYSRGVHDRVLPSESLAGSGLVGRYLSRGDMVDIPLFVRGLFNIPLADGISTEEVKPK